jgi:hypothetical protein
VTLILTCLAPDFVVQVSDRRTTLPDGRVVEDQFNKMLFLCSHAVMSVTGLGKVANESTVAWARERLAIGRDLVGWRGSFRR